MSLSTSNRSRFLSALFFVSLGCGIPAIGMAADDAESSKQKESSEGEKTRKVKFEYITLNVPESWDEQGNTTKFSKLEFKIAPVEGDSEPAELYVSGLSLFQPVGVTEPDVKSWIDGFQPEGRKAKITEGTSPQGKYKIVDVTGTHNKQFGVRTEPTKPLANARMLAAFLNPQEDLHYGIILSGPEKTVTAAAKAFRASFAADIKKEKEIKLKEDSK